MRLLNLVNYGTFKISGKKVLVVGAGPCGLRMAIEAQLMGNLR
jgi:NADPH-dependent 2,4-dienoyl-CoA reductase/sulfur reductase-like enzyme